MLVKVFRFLFGVYKVEISCKSVEKLLDLLIQNNISVSKIRKKQSNSVLLECDSESFKQIMALNCDNINEIKYKRYGIPSFVIKNKSRIGIVLGFIIFSVLLYFISLHIWHIEIVGCQMTNKYEILSYLDKSGFKIGVLKSKVDASKIENEVLYLTDKLSWMSINIKGTMATVEIRESNCKVKKLDTSKPSNIYASRDGFVDSVKAYMGYPVVKPGDTVTAGELLITGEYYDKFGKEFKLHSHGEVMAYTSHSFDVFVPLTKIEHQKTGKYKKKYKINVIRFSLPLYFSKKIYYNNYNKTVSVKKLKLFDSFYLPVSIEKTTYYETYPVQCSVSKDVALEEAYRKLVDKEVSLVGIDIIDREYDVEEFEDGIRVKLILSCYEDICYEKNM